MSQSSRAALEAALQNPDVVDVSDLPNVRVDLRYGTTQNLLKRDVYGGFQRALLHRIAADKFHRASMLLQKHYPHLKFLVFDALRPHAAQLEFWALVKGTPQEPFFANPERGSIHSFGFALDVGLCDLDGRELDLGTPFDDLTDLAGPKNEPEMLAAGRLSKAQCDRRFVLRSIMLEAGFLQLPHEWWHYDALPGDVVRSTYRRIG